MNTNKSRPSHRFGCAHYIITQTRVWDWRRFQSGDPSIYLYKMHGSIRWERDVAGGGIVRLVDNDPETPDLIFGTDYKLQYIDPYLFYAYEFRQYSLDASVILTIGYSFRDEHINGILAQALHNDPKRRIVVVTPDPELEISRFCEVNQDLKSKLVACRAGAKEFLSSVSVTKIEGLLREPITGGPAERF